MEFFSVLIDATLSLYLPLSLEQFSRNKILQLLLYLSLFKVLFLYLSLFKVLFLYLSLFKALFLYLSLFKALFLYLSLFKALFLFLFLLLFVLLSRPSLSSFFLWLLCLSLHLFNCRYLSFSQNFNSRFFFLSLAMSFFLRFSLCLFFFAAFVWAEDRHFVDIFGFPSMANVFFFIRRLIRICCARVHKLVSHPEK